VQASHLTNKKEFGVEKDSTLEILKQTLKDAIPAHDRRTTLPHLEFVCGFIFCFLGDTKTSSIESIRRFMIYTFGVRISKAAFWERLSRNRLNNILKDLLADLIKKTPSLAIVGEEILDKLRVSSILMVDSSSITLWDGAKKSFPGSRSFAGIKWHACFNLLSGKMEWFSTSASSAHDRKHFPDIQSLKGKLILFDLGYWDYGLFDAINSAQGFFLSRVKTNAVITINQVVKGIGKQLVGAKLCSDQLKKRRRRIVEFIGEIGSAEASKCYRVIGFWNAADKKYHWYVTNLHVPAVAIYSLYRIRWQIELIFKGCKRSLNVDGKVTSNNDNIIESLVLSTLIASFAIQSVFQESAKELTAQEKLSISFQRLSHIVVLLAQDFIHYLTSENSLGKLSNKISLFSGEIYEKNHGHRHTTLQLLANDLGCC
jgi:hypothetical protein